MKVAKRRHLVKRNVPVPVQLQQRQKTGHHDEGAVRISDQLPEGGQPGPPDTLGNHRPLLPHGNTGNVQVGKAYLRHRLRCQRTAGNLGELVRSDPEQNLGQQRCERLLKCHCAREPARFPLESLGELPGHLLEGLVLEEPREQQIAGLQDRQVFLVLDLPRRQQPSRFEVEQGGCNHQKLSGLIEAPLALLGPDVRNEIVRYLVQGEFGDFQLVFSDELQQQVERTFEVGNPDTETVWLRRRRHVGLGHARSVRGLVGAPVSSYAPAKHFGSL